MGWQYCIVTAFFVWMLSYPVLVAGGTGLSGYEKLGWNYELSLVVNRYPGGRTAKIGDEIVYVQQKPSRVIYRRNFGFKKGKLHAVSIVFEKGYVEKKGIEKVLADQIKMFGNATFDRSRAPHMLQHTWENGDTKITFAYAPKRPDMTVILFEQVGLPGD